MAPHPAPQARQRQLSASQGHLPPSMRPRPRESALGGSRHTRTPCCPGTGASCAACPWGAGASQACPRHTTRHTMRGRACPQPQWGVTPCPGAHCRGQRSVSGEGQQGFLAGAPPHGGATPWCTTLQCTALWRTLGGPRLWSTRLGGSHGSAGVPLHRAAAHERGPGPPGPGPAWHHVAAPVGRPPPPARRAALADLRRTGGAPDDCPGRRVRQRPGGIRPPGGVPGGCAPGPGRGRIPGAPLDGTRLRWRGRAGG